MQKYILSNMSQSTIKFDMKVILQTKLHHYHLKTWIEGKSNLIPKIHYTEVELTEECLINAPQPYHLTEYLLDLFSHSEGTNEGNQMTCVKEQVEWTQELLNDLLRQRWIDEKIWIRKKMGYDTLEQYLNNYKRKAYSIPMLTIENQGPILSFKEVSKQLMEKRQWINQIVDFFDSMTKHGMQFRLDDYETKHWSAKQSQCLPMDYFVYDEDGNVLKFVALTTLQFSNKWYCKDEQEFILENNIRAFRGFIEQLYSEIAQNQQYVFAGEFHKHPISILRNASYSYSDFEEINQILRTREFIKKIEPKIGVFMDTANILRGLHGLRIDFNRLYQQVYGERLMNQIQYKKCTLFVPTVSEKQEKQQLYSIEKALEEMAMLKKEGFEIVEVSNGEGKANQADDEALRECIKGHIHSVDQVLILSGDRHFLESMRLCRDHGLDVKVISNQESTAHEILIEEGIEHHYIEEYWTAVKLS